MNWIKHFVTLFLFTCGLVVRGSNGARSELHPAERFEFCVARNLSGSSLFNEEDKGRISKIVMETDLRMHEMKADPASAVNAKTMLRLFAAALACAVADCDSSVRPQREQACLTALEACAESLKEQAGAEIVKEMKKIFSAMNREISALDDNSASAESKTKERLEKETKAEKSKEGLEEAKSEKKEHSERETEAKERHKRAYVPAFRYQAFSSPLQSNPTLESIIAEKLLKSTTFKNLFTIGLSPEDAVFYARSMVSSGLGGYRYDIIDEAMNAVTNALYRLGSFSGSRDYAYAIGRSIASVLAAHELTFFADGLGIGSSLVYQLDSMLGSNPGSTSSFPSSFGAASVASSGWGSSSSVVSSHTSGMTSVQVNPGYVEPSFSVPSNPQYDKTQFQNRLSYSLSQSQKISGIFCSGPFPGLYEVMNSAFADYGYPVSSTIATVVSNSLSMLPTEAACTQYPEVISEVVADIFDNNGLIGAADPQVLTNKIADLISPNVQRYPPGNPSGFGQQTFRGSDYELNPSFTDYSYSAPEIPAAPVDQYSGSAVPNTPTQQQGPVLTNSTVVQPSNKQDFNLPAELSSDGVYLSDGSPLSADDSVATNNSWVMVDYPSDVLTALDVTNLTAGSIDIASPIELEPGPVIIPEKIPVDTGSESESKTVSPDKTTPGMIETTKVAEMTTPVPNDTSFQSSTIMAMSEVVTPAPQVALKDAFETQSKLSEFLLKEVKSSLKAMNITSSGEKKQQDIPETSGNSTDVKGVQTDDSPSTVKNPKPVERSDSQGKTPSNQTNTEVQPSGEPPLQQDGSSDEVPLEAPKPITDEVSALVFAEKVSAIVSSSIRLIRSEDLQFDELCKRLNELAPLVDLPPLDVYAELPLIDYLLHVLNAVTYSLAGEK